MGFQSGAFAQTPQSTTATFGDWVVHCERIDQGAACETTQTTLVKETNQVASVIAIAAGRGNGPTKVVFQTAVNIWLQTGITLASRDGQIAIAANFLRCVPTGCFAETEISPNVMQKLRAMRDPGSLRFKDASQNDVAIAVSFNGFGQAYDALSKASTGR
jgi:invasion protein IalB